MIDSSSSLATRHLEIISSVTDGALSDNLPLLFLSQIYYCTMKKARLWWKQIPNIWLTSSTNGIGVQGSHVISYIWSRSPGGNKFWIPFWLLGFRKGPFLHFLSSRAELNVDLTSSFVNDRSQYCADIVSKAHLRPISDGYPQFLRNITVLLLQALAPSAFATLDQDCGREQVTHSRFKIHIWSWHYLIGNVQ